MQSWQYIALLGAVIAVVALLLPKGKNQNQNASSSAQTEQLELAFEQFMDNMESEHNDLVKMLTESLQQLREEDRVKSETITRLEQRNEKIEEQLVSLSQQVAAYEAKLQLLLSKPDYLASGTQESSHGSKSIHAELTEVRESIVEEDLIPTDSIQKRYAELLEMYHSGKSIEAIAKKLGKNKGEVQLIIQLAMQEEKSRHA